MAQETTVPLNNAQGEVVVKTGPDHARPGYTKVLFELADGTHTLYLNAETAERFARELLKAAERMK